MLLFEYEGLTFIILLFVARLFSLVFFSHQFLVNKINNFPSFKLSWLHIIIIIALLAMNAEQVRGREWEKNKWARVYMWGRKKCIPMAWKGMLHNKKVRSHVTKEHRRQFFLLLWSPLFFPYWMLQKHIMKQKRGGSPYDILFTWYVFFSVWMKNERACKSTIWDIVVAVVFVFRSFFIHNVSFDACICGCICDDVESLMLNTQYTIKEMMIIEGKCAAHTHTHIENSHSDTCACISLSVCAIVVVKQQEQRREVVVVECTEHGKRGRIARE